LTDAEGNSQGFVAGEGEASQDTLGVLTIDAEGNWEYSVANDDIAYLNADETKEELFTVTAEDGSTQEISVTITGIDSASDESSDNLDDILPESTPATETEEDNSEETQSEETQSEESSSDSQTETQSEESNNDSQVETQPEQSQESMDIDITIDPTVVVTVDDQISVDVM